MNSNRVNQKIQKKIFAELDSIERETTDNKILEAVTNIRIDELKLSMEKIEKKHQEETMYWRDKIDNWEERYDLQVLESNKKFGSVPK